MENTMIASRALLCAERGWSGPVTSGHGTLLPTIPAPDQGSTLSGAARKNDFDTVPTMGEAFAGYVRPGSHRLRAPDQR